MPDILYSLTQYIYRLFYHHILNQSVVYHNVVYKLQQLTATISCIAWTAPEDPGGCGIHTAVLRTTYIYTIVLIVYTHLYI